MADETDVEGVIAAIIAASLYPNGTSQPSVATSGTGIVNGIPAAVAIQPVKVNVFRGWPTTQQQTDAIANNYVNVSVAARNNAERNLSRYPILAQQSSAPVHTITATVNGNRVTIGGTISVPQNVILLIGSFNQFGYAVQANDTPASIAANLAATVNGVFPGMASATGATITLNTGRSILARVAGQGQTVTETKRQEKLFQVCVWAPPCSNPGVDPDSWRTAVVNVIDPALSNLIRITLPDNTFGHIHYQSTWSMEAAESEGLYRRDLFYWVEYGTTITGVAAEIGAVQTQVTASLTPDGTLATFPTAGPPLGPPTVNAES